MLCPYKCHVQSTGFDISPHHRYSLSILWALRIFGGDSGYVETGLIRSLQGFGLLNFFNARSIVFPIPYSLL
jgi:hypothetical protein